jgi:hypothetical protein
MKSARVVELEDWSEARATFDAAVYPSLVVAQRSATIPGSVVRIAEHHRDRVLSWTTPAGSLAIDDSPGAPWLWLPASPRGGFEHVRTIGTSLGERSGFRPRLGVKCGYNEAFIIRRGPDGSFIARDGRRAQIERSLVRPLVRGESVTPWALGAMTDSILFPYDESLNVVRSLPPLARQWLWPLRTQLRARSDLGGRTEWWSLFRTEAADFSRARVVWADLSRTPRAAVIAPGDRVVPLNTCYVVFADSMPEAYALATYLNSPLAAAWLAALAEPARGGFRRMFGWTVSLMPIPRDWEAAVATLAPLGERAARGDVPPPEEILHATLAALGVAEHQVAALLTWGHR